MDGEEEGVNQNGPSLYSEQPSFPSIINSSLIAPRVWR